MVQNVDKTILYLNHIIIVNNQGIISENKEVAETVKTLFYDAVNASVVSDKTFIVNEI